MALLANGGMLPAMPTVSGPKEISARRKGVRQGGILLLTGVLLVPLLGMLGSYSNSNFLELLTAIAALLCFLGGPLRMLYAGLFEEGAPSYNRPGPYIQPPIQLHQGPPVRSALPPPAARQSVSWSPRPQTGELVRPSVTEGTTRLLDKDDPVNH
jgi:hypothetical protein